MTFNVQQDVVRPVYKAVKFANMQCKQETVNDAGQRVFTFEGFGSTFGNVDSDGDVIEAGAFTESLKQRRPKLLLQHAAWDVPIGVFKEVSETEQGLFVKGEMPLDDARVRDMIVPQMINGALSDLSIGFTIKSAHIDDDDEDEVRRITEVELFEISLVTFPANEEAVVTGIKMLSPEQRRHVMSELQDKTVVPFQDLPLSADDRVWVSSEAILRVRDLTDSQEEPSDTYRTAFLQFDGDAPELFGSYKLPIADVIDGVLTAVPNAIRNANARLSQTDMPEADRDRVQANLDRYLEKIREAQEGSADDDVEAAQTALDVLDPKTRGELVADVFVKSFPKITVKDLKNFSASVLEERLSPFFSNKASSDLTSAWTGRSRRLGKSSQPPQGTSEDEQLKASANRLDAIANSIKDDNHVN